MALPTSVRTALAVTGAAVIGSLGTDPTSTWYRALKKPSWQPPPPAYGLVWAPLYVVLTVASAQALDRLPEPERARYRRALAANLVLNAGWSWVFFRMRRPWAAVAVSALLCASSADLVRRTAVSSPRAAAALAPYPAWCGFATVLTGALARRNPPQASWTGQAVADRAGCRGPGRLSWTGQARDS